MKAMSLDYPSPKLFINGVWRDSSDKQTIPVINPATGTTLAELPVATDIDLDEAVAAAEAGFKIWRKKTALERSDILRKAANLLRERAEHIGRLTTLEQGKPVIQSTQEVFGSAGIFDWYAEEARRAYGRIVPSKFPGVRQMVLKEPIGPVAAFAPWNFPTTIPARKIGAALAAGCSMVFKPAEETPVSALELARALDDAGLPKGVLNVVTGVPAQISEYLIASPVIRKISFTGSTAVGKHLAQLAAQQMKPTTMELGGHAPVIVFDDADIDKAVEMLTAFKFRNAGQICICPTRFFLQENIHDDFVAKFSSYVRSMKVGDGLDRENAMGPLAHERRPDAVATLVEDAIDQGAKVVDGAKEIAGDGYFWEPTVLSDVPDSARIMTEEPFGPVVVTRRFSTFDEVIEQANRTPYGLAGYAFSTSARTCADLADSVEVGMLGINHTLLTGPETPFGGVKESGHGSEGGIEGLEAYLITKYVAQG
jgi:succinate-semialdehyde dehydrogenase/glutarate-semialdehyde dehydrogenase